MTQHFALPLRLAPDGRLLALPEDSDAEVAQSVQVLLSTRVGERRSEPSYGSTDPLFTQLNADSPSDVDTGAIARWEPRAAGRIGVSTTSSW